MRGYTPQPTSPQAHIPEVYHHTEHRGNNPVNVTTYVFQTNKGPSSNAVPSFSRSRAPVPAQMRSRTPQPVSTFYHEDRNTNRNSTFGRAPASNYHISETAAPMSNGLQPQPPPQYYYTDPDAIDDSHVLSVRESKALFEKAPSWRSGVSPSFNASSRTYQRHTSRISSASAPPSPGKYELRTRPTVEQYHVPGYELHRATSKAVPMKLELNQQPGSIRYVSNSQHSGHPLPKYEGGRHSTLPVYQRIVPREDTSEEPPAWYGSLRRTKETSARTTAERFHPIQHSPPNPSGPNYGSLPRQPPRSRSVVPSGDRHRSINDDVFSPESHQSHVNRFEYQNYKTVATPIKSHQPQQQHFVSAQALKRSVTTAAANKQLTGGLLKPSGPHHYGGAGGYSSHRATSATNLHNGGSAHYPNQHDYYY